MLKLKITHLGKTLSLANQNVGCYLQRGNWGDFHVFSEGEACVLLTCVSLSGAASLTHSK